jgi:hypothetical protein
MATNAQEAVVDCIIGKCKQRRLSRANLAQAVQSAAFNVEPVVGLHSVADGEHRICSGIGSRSLDQFNIAICVAKTVTINGTKAAVMRAAGVLQQWPNLQPLAGLGQWQTGVCEAAKQVVRVPLGRIQ